MSGTIPKSPIVVTLCCTFARSLFSFSAYPLDSVKVELESKEIEDARDAGLLSMDSLFGQREQELVKRKQLETESGTLKSRSATGSFTIPGIGQAHAFDMKPSKISKLGLDFATLKDIQMQTNELLGGDLGEQDPTLYMLATQYP